MISGNFEGECRSELIQILPGGKLSGTLYSEQLIIEPGGHFFGDSHSLTDKKGGLELVRSEEIAKEKQS
ncbi:MAG: polymer-forming cytoskeletal protein [Algicola sp.]|nr:polymer-forming cytoskeletal protein [Algicola sp.]